MENEFWYAVIQDGEPVAFCSDEEQAESILENSGAEKIIPIPGILFEALSDFAREESDR